MKKNQFILVINKLIPLVVLVLSVCIAYFLDLSYGFSITCGVVLILVFKIISNGMISGRVERENQLLLTKLKRQINKNISTFKKERALLAHANGSGRLDESVWNLEINKFIRSTVSDEAISNMNIPRKEALNFLMNYVNDYLMYTHDLDQTDPGYIAAMTAVDLQLFCGDLLKDNGWSIEQVYPVMAQETILLATRDVSTVIVWCNNDISVFNQGLFEGLRQYSNEKTVIVCNSTLNSMVESLAHKHDIKLIQANDLLHL